MKARPQSSRSRSVGERDRESGGAGIAHPSLLRLILDYRSGELVARVPYRSEDGPSPGTKARTKIVADLARAGLTQALMDLEAGAEYVDVGTSGFTTGEDVILATASLDVAKRYDAQRREEMRAAWISYHAGQARRHRRTLEALIEDHKAQAARLCED